MIRGKLVIVRIVVCHKNVPDEQDIRVASDGALSLASAKLKTGTYDLCAVEVAVALAETNPGSEVIALTASAVEDKQISKGVLARGPDRLVIVRDEALAVADAYATAAALVSAIERLGDIDIVFFGEGSGDLYAQQVGPLVGAMLGWPTLNAVVELAVTGPEEITVSRRGTDGMERLAVALPAAIALRSDSATSRIPTMRDILAAGKKPVDTVPLTTSGQPRVTALNLVAAPQVDRRRIIYSAVDADALDALAEQLKSHLPNR